MEEYLESLWDTFLSVPPYPFVISKKFKSLRYDPGSEILFAEFGNGAVYAYFDITPDKAQQLEETSETDASVGKEFIRQVEVYHENLCVVVERGEKGNVMAQWV